MCSARKKKTLKIIFMFVVQLLHDFYTKQQLKRNAHVSVIAQLFRKGGSNCEVDVD